MRSQGYSEITDVDWELLEAEMLTVEQLQHAIQSLPEEDYVRFREWLLDWDHEWDDWDRQIAADSKAGKLDFLVAQAKKDKEMGRLRGLPGVE